MKKIAVYKNKESGEILRLHKIPEDRYHQVESAKNEYNNAEREDAVYIVDLADGSLELYLFDRSELDIRKYRNEIGDMLDQVHDLCTSVDQLHELATKAAN